MASSVVHSLISRAKFHVCSRMSPKLYWYLMGELKAVPAVTSDFRMVEECLASGEQVVGVLERLGVVHKDMVALQVGSGLGRIEAHLCHRVRHCYGLDVSPSMVRKARGLVREPNVTFVCGDGTGLDPWPGDSFDLIYSFLVFQHMPRPQFQKYVREAFAKLKPTGALVFQIPVDETGTLPEPGPKHPYGLRYYTRSAVLRVLTAAGFTNNSCFAADGASDPGRPVTDLVFRALKSGPAAPERFNADRR